jgi:photosystem II stability/assembly factor-like uncharacterized protein
MAAYLWHYRMLNDMPMKSVIFSLLLINQILLAQTKEVGKDSPEERLKFEFNRTKSPITGKVPLNELEKARSLMTKVVNRMTAGQIPGVEWQERGPNNIGGRTRAIMFDPNDATKKKVWAGGVAGGLWYNNDITNVNSSWQKVFDFWDNMAISCIAYSPNNTNIFYVGTGEGYGNADGLVGGGIWKTTNGGLTWARLSATIPDYEARSGQGYAFQNVQKIVVSSTGRVFAATQAGVWISSDGGNTWSVVLSLPHGGAAGFFDESFVSDLEIGTDNVVYAAFGFFSNTIAGIYKTTNSSNDGTAWSANLHRDYGGRTEIALAPSTSGATQIIYAVVQGITSNYIGYFRRSNDGGNTWTNITIPTGGGTYIDISNGQAWYDLILSVHPTNPNILYAAGATNARSLNANTSNGANVSWNVSEYGDPVHPDHHAAIFRPNFPNEVIFGNDGGVYYSPNWGNNTVANPTYEARNKDYNVTQYYSAAMKNVANDGYIIAAAQDNGSQKITTAPETIGSGTYLQNCCDGMVTFIDQNEPNIQIHAPQYNGFWLYNEATGQNAEIMPEFARDYGHFVNPADYDSDNNILYTDEFGANFFSKIARVKINSGNPATVGNYSEIQLTESIIVSFIKVAKAPNTLFLGSFNGFIYKITNADGVSTPTTTLIGSFYSPYDEVNVSCIDVGANDNELLVTLSNYDVKSVYYTNDGGVTWTSKDEPTYGLPNIPVRAVLFNPMNRQQVLLATELGVWSTNALNLANPQWAPTNAKLAHVRCDQLRYRTSDRTVLVATHGRGVFTAKLNQRIPCQTVMMLLAPYDNKTSGTSSYANTQTISATNQISGNANVTYNASNYIELNPVNPSDGAGGFKVDRGAVFQTYIQGCGSANVIEKK